MQAVVFFSLPYSSRIGRISRGWPPGGQKHACSCGFHCPRTLTDNEREAWFYSAEFYSSGRELVLSHQLLGPFRGMILLERGRIVGMQVVGLDVVVNFDFYGAGKVNLFHELSLINLLQFYHLFGIVIFLFIFFSISFVTDKHLFLCATKFITKNLYHFHNRSHKKQVRLFFEKKICSCFTLYPLPLKKF